MVFSTLTEPSVLNPLLSSDISNNKFTFSINFFRHLWKAGHHFKSLLKNCPHRQTNRQIHTETQTHVIQFILQDKYSRISKFTRHPSSETSYRYQGTVAIYDINEYPSGEYFGNFDDLSKSKLFINHRGQYILNSTKPKTLKRL